VSSYLLLRTLTPDDLSTVSPWFEDSQTSRYLGGRDWPRRMLELDERLIGIEFRGATQTSAHRFLAYWEDRPIGMIDCGVFDRWTRYAGEDADGPIITDSIEVTTGSIAFVIAPTLRNQGFGRSMIRALVEWSELSEVRLFEAGVEPENHASVRCLLAAGFVPHGSEPDFEGMVYYTLSR
jgi:RimJ/RimL family protein N-acetyltransferase